ncbi:MAG: LamG-like jellyroll fold domain-containing protein [bacterium]
MGGGWWRLTYSGAVATANGNYGVEVQSGKTIYLDSVQLEQKPVATTYTDGTLGSGYAWSGVAHASASIRENTNLQYAVTDNIQSSAGTVSFWLKIPWAGNDSLNHVLFDTDTSSGTLKLTKNSSNNLVLTDGTNTASKAVSWSANSWQYITATWGAGDMNVYVNAVAGTASGIFSPPTLTTNLYLGQDKTNASFADAYISGIRVFDSSLSTNEINDLYNSGFVSHSFGTVETRYQTTRMVETATIDGTSPSNWLGLSWDQTLPGSEGASPIRFQVAVKSTDSAWADSDFVGSDCTSGTYFTDLSNPFQVNLTASCNSLFNPNSTNSKRYARIRLYLQTADTTATPEVSNISLVYNHADILFPVLSINPFIPDPTSDNTPLLTGQAADAQDNIRKVEFQVDSTVGSWIACTSADGAFNTETENFNCQVVTNLSDASHTIYFRSEDINDNLTSVGSYSSDTFMVDTTKPIGTISINSNSTYTNSKDVTLMLTEADNLSGTTQMMICNDETFTGCSYEAYSNMKAWTLTTVDGTKTVYLKLKDAAGNESDVYEDDIILDMTINPPIISQIGEITNIPDKPDFYYYFTTTTATIRGTADPGDTVTFLVDGKTLTTIADTLGSFQLTIKYPDLTNGDNPLQYFSEDLAGNISPKKAFSLIIGCENFPDNLQAKYCPFESVEALPQDLAKASEGNGSEKSELPETGVEDVGQGVIIKFYDSEGAILSFAEVTINGKIYTTDKNGEVIIYGIDKEAEILFDGEKKVVKVSELKDGKLEMRAIVGAGNIIPSITGNLVIVGSLILVLMFATVIFLGIKRSRGDDGRG